MPIDSATRKFTISFPEDLARKVDLLAKEESRNTSELFREAFRTYFAQQIGVRMQTTRDLAKASSVNSKGETILLLKEARREMKASSKQ